MFDTNGANQSGIDHTVQFVAMHNGLPDGVPIITDDATLTDLDDVGGDCKLDLPVSCTIELTNPLNGRDEFLVMTQRPRSLLSANDDHIITLISHTSGVASDYILAIRSISYNNLAEEPDETPRLINITCFDGVLNSNPSSGITVNIQVNDDSPLNGVDTSGKDFFHKQRGAVESVLASQLTMKAPYVLYLLVCHS